MFEVIVTLIKQESFGGATYPTTEVHRLVFDTEEAFRTWKDMADTLHQEQLTAK